MKNVNYKYLVMLGDGMADRPNDAIGGKTPLEAANKPNMDFISFNGQLGLVKTVPDHLNPPGSDIANMSVLGYDPDIFYTGRSPLEAVSMGITMAEDDVAIRCNLVTLSDEENYEDRTMVDYSSGSISSAEASELIKAVDEKLGTDLIHFYPGVSYRHCLILNHIDNIDMKFTPPHDISGRCIKDHLPKGQQGEMLYELMKKSTEILKNHPVNKARIAKGLRPATSIWLWGEGRKPGLSDFYMKTGLRGAVVSAVDLVKGLGLCAGMEVPSVPGANGDLDTNFEGKAQAAIDFYKNGGDLVYMHVEAPDECGHRGEINNKIKAIELIDERLLTPILNYFNECEAFKILLLPDHPTPICVRTHTHDAVPFAIYDSKKPGEGSNKSYSEANAHETGVYVPKGSDLMDIFIGKAGI